MTIVLANKEELAAALNVSRPTVDAMLRRWPDFPVVAEGTNGRAWQFDPAACIAFVAEKHAESARESAEREEFFRQFTLPGTDPDLPTGAKPAELLQLARVRQMQRTEARENGLLVPTSDVRQALTAAFARLNRAMNAALAAAARRHALSDAVLRDIQAQFHDAQRNFVADTANFAPEEASLGL